jgi:hypothetical protein
MNKEETIQALTLAIKEAKDRLASAEHALEDFNSLPENNVFETLEDAEYSLTEKLEALASADCEGSYNRGCDEYEQEFIVQGEHYVGTLKVEYNRYEKMYYYVDQTRFTITKEETP